MAAPHFNVDPADSPRKKKRGLVVSVAFILTGIAAMWALDYQSIGPFASKEHDVQKKTDAAELPFTISTLPETSEPPNWAMVLDRELSASESRKMTSLTDSSAVFSYLAGLGGRPLAYTAPLENAPEHYKERTSADGVEFASVIKLNMLSIREKGVLIDRWDIVDIRCEPSTAKAVVAFPPQGGEPYEGIRFHLPPRAGEPVLTDDTDGQGEPYFKLRRVEVGGGQPSLGLRMETIASAGQSCTWGIKVHYIDAYNNDADIRLKDRDGKPLVLRTESIPQSPPQTWVSGPVPWTACHDKPQEPMCELIPR
ncbi:hypothetical protein ACFTTN_29120 [Streptomyces niveus]|uniref:hypothetical protein n=1 Tax=Streptomyces niveus TaxID=193462 RepID=UPI00362AD76C